MRQWISKRQAAIGPNTMMALFANAKKYPDVINLSIGDPDIPTPQAILDAMYQDSCKGHTKYTPSKGDPELIQAVCDFYKEEHGLALGPEWITITPAACSGMYQVMQAVLDPGDEVLIFSPYFSPYASQTQAAGGVPVLVPCLAEEGFQPNAQRAAAYVTPKTKAMIVNTPNNPTGACYTRETLEGLAALAKAADLLVIADDIYTDLCFTSEFLPIMTLPGMQERTVTLGSCSKNFVMTGMRIGWVAAPPEVAEGVRYVGENIIYCAPSPGQRAALYALRHRAELRPLVGPVGAGILCPGPDPSAALYDRLPGPRELLCVPRHRAHGIEQHGSLPGIFRRSPCAHAAGLRVRPGGGGLYAHRLHPGPGTAGGGL